ncbi:hypothetical protein R75461_07789 [Paraburkholderia nemoris]|uniref:putative hemolysin n=1 Tax=Paraburkholderia nemoris TaxID=2793076 RepID=UPI00190B2B7E|nr:MULTISPECIES: DUF333 domain-containing protein [Paraburkholderia]MBK3786512.1 DUF333 domain-containing protein [Paraburkholderia aspalathi]CAE6857373.1 hypothetical protein R75461_07789 [Paraburkholderia nemoris]
MKKFLMSAVTGLFVMAASAQPLPPGAAGATPVQAARQASMSNPASVNCVRQGGTLHMIHASSGAVGMCSFPNGRRCEQWALLRDECSPDQK